MVIKALENLVKIRKLNPEPPDQTEFDGMATVLICVIWCFNVCPTL